MIFYLFYLTKMKKKFVEKEVNARLNVANPNLVKKKKEEEEE